MAQTRLRLAEQLPLSSDTGAVLATNASNKAEWVVPTGGDNRLFYYKDSTGLLTELSIGTNLSITSDTLNASAGAGGYATVQEEGSDLTVRTKLNFVGAGITAADDAGNTRTNVTLDATLNALAGLDTTAGYLVQTGTDTFAKRTLTGTSNRITVTNGDGTSGNPVFDISASYVGQSSITTLGTISTGLWQGTTIDELYGGTGQSTYTKGDILWATASNTLGKLGVGSQGYVLRVGASNTVEWSPVTDLGFSTKNSVLVATTANITLSGEQTIDGVTTSGSRVLVKNQSTTSQNGIYVSAAGAWSRATDADSWSELVSAYVWVEEGSTYADTGWLCTVDAGGTLGSTSVTWTQQSGAATITAGAGLTKTGNTLDVGTASSSRIVVNTDNIDLATTAVSAASYGSATQVATFTVDAYGRLTAAGNTTIAVTSSAVSDFTEAVQDVVGNATFLPDTNTIDWTYSDAGGTLSAAVKTQMSLTSDSSGIKLSGDASTPGSTKYYGTDGSGTKGFHTLPTGVSADRKWIEGASSSSFNLATSGVVKDIDGNNSTFSIPSDHNLMAVYRNGMRMSETGSLTTRDYSISGTTLTFTIAVTSEEIIVIERIA